MMSPSGALKVVSDRSATTTAACGPFEVLVGRPGKKKSHHTSHQLGERAIKNIEEIHITWCFTEGESIDNHFSLNREEQSTPIWTPTARLDSDNMH